MIEGKQADIERLPLWSVPGGLFAIAGAIFIVAVIALIGLTPGRYQFAPSTLDGQTVWRGDTVTGHAVLCATERYAAQAEAHALPEGIVSRC